MGGITAKIRDRRSRLMSEILDGIRIIKFFAWEDSFVSRILGIRSEEIAILTKSLLYRAIMAFLAALAPVLVIIITFVVYISLGNEMNAEKAFTSIGTCTNKNVLKLF
jgi:hypothetical protein